LEKDLAKAEKDLAEAEKNLTEAFKDLTAIEKAKEPTATPKRELTEAEKEKEKADAKQEKTDAKRWLKYIYGTGVGILVVSLVIVGALWYFGVGSVLKNYTVTAASVSIFAIFYLLAQFDERLVEPFSNLWAFGYSSSDKSADLSKKDQGSDPSTTNQGSDPSKANQSSDSKEKNPYDDARKEARVVSLWCFASGVGIILCYFTVGLLQVLGTIPSSNLSHLGDAILSGVIVGGGTKPLHDLINLFDNSSSKSS